MSTNSTAGPCYQAVNASSDVLGIGVRTCPSLLLAPTDHLCPLDTHQLLLYHAGPRDYPTNAGHRGALKLVLREFVHCGLWPPPD